MAPPLTLSSKITREYAGLSLLAYLCGRYAYKDEAGWREEVAKGALSVNGRPAQAGQILNKGDLCSYTTDREEPWVNKDVKLLWQDEFLLFVDKPAPLPSHADGVFIRHTLIHITRELFPSKELYLGHRLDRETSGVCVLAKDKVLLGALMPLFEQGKVKKTYLALCRGESEEENFEISGGMARDPKSQISMRWKLFPAGTPDSKESRTLFRVKQRLKGHTLLECQPLTGRTNQIRVHCEAAGLPILGDKLYGHPDEDFLKFLAHVKAGGDSRFEVDGAQRHMLHAASLEFIHPVKEIPLKIEAAMPEDMAAMIQKLP